LLTSPQAARRLDLLPRRQAQRRSIRARGDERLR